MSAEETTEAPTDFMSKMKAQMAQVQEGMAPHIASAKEKAGAMGTQVQEKYQELRAQMGPKIESTIEAANVKLQSAKEGVVDAATKAQEAIGPAMQKAKDATVDAATKAKEAIDPAMQKAKEAIDPAMQKAGEAIGPAMQKAKEAIDPAMVKVAETVGPAMEKAKEWGSNVYVEWQQPYKGKIFEACFCTLTVCDFNFPDALGFRYKGLCCCVDGECTACTYNPPKGIDKKKPFNLIEFDLMYIKPPYFNKDADGEGTKGGSLCKSVCHCCCVEERFAFPQDDEVPMMFGLCCIVLMQGKKCDMKVKMTAPSEAKTMREQMRAAETAEAMGIDTTSGSTDVAEAAAPMPAEMVRTEEDRMPKTNTYFKACKAETKALQAGKELEESKAAADAAKAELAKASEALAKASSDEEKAAAAELEAAAKKAVEDSEAAAKEATSKVAATKAELEKIATELAIEQAAMAAAASDELADEQPEAVKERTAALAAMHEKKKQLEAVKTAAFAVNRNAEILDDSSASAARALFMAAAAEYDKSHPTEASSSTSPAKAAAPAYIWRQVNGVWKKVPP